MKRNFLTVITALAAVFFMGATIVSADVEFGGQFRPRLEVSQRDFNSNTDALTFIQSRIRLDTKVTADDNISAFFQLQSTPTWGFDQKVFQASDSSSAAGCSNSGVSTTAASLVNPHTVTCGADDKGVTIHQAYVVLGNLFGMPVDLKLGRQEIIFDGHRIVGNTGWTAGAVRHDALRLDHGNDTYAIVYVFSKASELGTLGNDDVNDTNFHMFHFSLKELLGGKLSVLAIYTDDNLGDGTGPGGVDIDNDFYTLGVRQAGSVAGFSWRVEGYYQGGDADLCSDGNCFALTGGETAGFDRSAFLLAARAGYKFDVATAPSITLWLDYLSGDDNAADTDINQWFTLLDTGHKYYGFMDHFLTVGRGTAGGATLGLGLVDLAIKTSISPTENLLVKADIHSFYTAEDAQAGMVPASEVGENHLGEEVDLTLVHTYSESTKIIVGYSHFFASDLMASVAGRNMVANPDDSDWGYVMVDFKY